MCCCVVRYNCNRYDEDEAKKARDSQEVGVNTRLIFIGFNGYRVSQSTDTSIPTTAVSKFIQLILLCLGLFLRH